MQRKMITLSKDAVLWHAGDGARELAVLEKGRLGARSERGLVGVIWPQMVLGESALLAREDAAPEPRSISVVALEDDTRVDCYPAEAVRDAIVGGDDSLARTVLDTLVGQICRNLLLVLTVRKGEPYLDQPLSGLVHGVIEEAQRRAPIASWEAFVRTARFLSDLRDVSDRTLAVLGPEIASLDGQVESASKLLKEILQGREAPSGLSDFLAAEREKAAWWARSG
jgi:CRP-like cAMP-binding protein